MNTNHKNLFQPIRIGACAIKNRYAMAPMGPAGLVDSDGTFTQRAVDFYVRRAQGGVGLIITGMCFSENQVEKHGAGTMPCPTQNPLLFARSGKLLTERVHAYGTKIFLQLSAGFGRVANRVMPGEEPLAPSPVPYMWDASRICRPLTTEEVESIVEGIAASAAIAKRVGFDGVEIHAMHEGYLLDQFALACCNKRDDRYGGSLENRVRFAVEIREAIASACGREYPVVMRYSSKSFMKDFGIGAVPGEAFTEFGRDLPEGLEIAAMLEAAGYDALDADVGCYDSWYWNHPPMYQEKGLYLPFNALLKEAVSIPVITAGRLDDPDLAADALEKGQTDMIGLARPLLADPDLVEKVRAGQRKDIRPCISCQEACMGRLKAFMHISCAVNPAACREREYALTPAAESKLVLVVGGGPAGCEAARVLALRGHRPVLVEQRPELGGNLLPGGAPGFKEDDLALAAWYRRQLSQLHVPVQLGKRLDGEDIAAYNPDVVILATGSSPISIPLPGDLPVLLAQDVLTGKENPGSTTVVVGGGLVGCELALHLAQKGISVTLVEQEDSLMAVNGPLCYANKVMLQDLLNQKGVEVVMGSRAVRSEKGGLIAVGSDGQEGYIPADSVILSVGYRPENSLMEELEGWNKPVYLLGDAREVSNILYAIWDAYEVARFIE